MGRQARSCPPTSSLLLAKQTVKTPSQYGKASPLQKNSGKQVWTWKGMMLVSLIMTSILISRIKTSILVTLVNTPAVPLINTPPVRPKPPILPVHWERWWVEGSWLAGIARDPWCLPIVPRTSLISIARWISIVPNLSDVHSFIVVC